VSLDRKTGQVGHYDWYLVEYDLPTDNRRKRFYRAVHRYLRDFVEASTGWSSQSVVITKDKNFAWFVFREARKVGGLVHIYEARRIDHEL